MKSSRHKTGHTGMRRALVYAVLCLAVVVILNGLLVYFLVNFGARCCSQLILDSGDIVPKKYAENWLSRCQEICSYDVDPTQSQKTQLSSQDYRMKYLPNNEAFLEKTVFFITLRKNSLSEREIEDISVKSLTKNLQILVINSEGLFDGFKSRIFANNAWNLQEISFQRQKELFVEELAWKPRSYSGLYLVTWEIDGGGLKGHLLTDSTRVTLSLWPDTLYHVQVKAISRSEGKMDKSEILTVDTSRDEKAPTLKYTAIFSENKLVGKPRIFNIPYIYLIAISLLAVFVVICGIRYRIKTLEHTSNENPYKQSYFGLRNKLLGSAEPFQIKGNLCCDDTYGLV